MLCNIQFHFEHASLHLRCSFIESHKVHRFSAAAHTYAQAVNAGLLNKLAWNGVLGGSRSKRRNRVRFHANERRMIQHGDRLRAGANKRQLVDIDIDGQAELSSVPLTPVIKNFVASLKSWWSARMRPLVTYSEFKSSRSPLGSRCPDSQR